MIIAHWVAAALFIVAAIVSFALKNCYEEYTAQLGTFGTLSSIIAFAIVIYQLWQTQTVAEATKEKTEIIRKQAEIIENHTKETKDAVEKSLQHTKKILTLTETTQILHLPNEIQDALQNKQLSRAYEKMRNLKDDMVALKASPAYQEEEISKQLTTYISDLTVRLSSLSKAVQEEKEKMYAQDKTISLLEDIRTFLKLHSALLKTNNL